MPRVLNMRNGNWGSGAQKIDRSTPYGNPFVIGRDGNRGIVCDKFEEWVRRPEQAALREQAKRELKDCDLLCWCAPERCHGDLWIQIANE